MNIQNILIYIGLYAPIILFFLTLILLRNKISYLQFFVLGFILNSILNVLLKLFIKDPRPSHDKKTLEIGITNGQRIGFDKFGMPSGHAQICGFCTTFIFLTLNNPFFTFLYSFITIITVLQRYLFNNHTLFQLLVGLFIGSTFGFIIYTITNKYIIGNKKLKRDDDGPI